MVTLLHVIHRSSLVTLYPLLVARYPSFVTCYSLMLMFLLFVVVVVIVVEENRESLLRLVFIIIIIIIIVHLRHEQIVDNLKQI